MSLEVTANIQGKSSGIWMFPGLSPSGYPPVPPTSSKALKTSSNTREILLDSISERVYYDLTDNLSVVIGEGIDESSQGSGRAPERDT